MSIVDGYKKVKRYIQTDDGHELMSQWTSSDTVEIDGKTLTETLTTKADLDSNGQVKLEQIPKVALDKLVKVENDTARFALTTDDVQTGDTVLVADTERMYLVVDDTKLDNEDGYTGYSASTTWETIEGKPEDIGEVVHLTQAEYDVLPDSKLTDDVVYMITDAEGNSGGVSSWNDLEDKPNNLVYSSSGEATSITVVKELTERDIVDDLVTEDNNKVLSAAQGKVLNNKVEEATNIAKGRNRVHVFSTTADMQAWLSDENNKGQYNVGDNLYIVDIDVPDWWISAVLNTADASTGYYYNIAQLETQKVDLTNIEADIESLKINIQTQLDAKANQSGWTASRVICSNSSGKLTPCNTTTTEIGYLSGVTSAIQTQINTLNTNFDKYSGSNSIVNLYEFTGTTSTTVTLSEALSNFRIVQFILIDSSSYVVNSMTISQGTWLKLGNAIYLYGKDDSQWALITPISGSYTKLKLNRTSSNTSKLVILGIR